MDFQISEDPGRATRNDGIVALGTHICSREKSSRWLLSKRFSVESTGSEKRARLRNAERIFIALRMKY